MSALVQTRHRQLHHHLADDQARMVTDAGWLISRAHRYAAAAEVLIEVVLDPAQFARRTGLSVPDTWAGVAYTGPAHQRLRAALVYLNQALMPTRGDAERVIAHEIMHVRWPSYGHREVAFTRAQQLLDTVDSHTT